MSSNHESPCPNPPKDERPAEWIETQHLIAELFRRFPSVVVITEFVPDMTEQSRMCAHVVANCIDSHTIGLLGIANSMMMTRCLSTVHSVQ